MKLKQFKSKQILKLHLLNSRVYESPVHAADAGFLTELNLTQIMNDFKKALHVIFQYHQAEKRILFIGIPKQLEIKVNRSTHHVAVPANFNLQGLISKSSTSVKSSKHSASNLYLSSLLPKLSKKPDLVVLFSHEKKQMIVTETYLAKIPLIVLNSDSSSNDSDIYHSCRGIETDVAIGSKKTLFFIALNFLFKRMEKKSMKQTANSIETGVKKRFSKHVITN